MSQRVKILKLLPTQFAIGMLEVDEKISEFKRMGKKARKRYIAENPVPVVRTWDGDLYVVDKHHFLCVCYHVGIKKVKVTVATEFSGRRMSYAAFWRWMFKHRNAYPFCQFGEGPREALYLPKDVRGLADDPYRSLAWFVRKAGAFENSEKNFAEFQWANFFRERRLLEKAGLKGMPKALLQAAELAQSPAARHLPGYGKLNLQEVKTVKKKVRARAKKLEKGGRSSGPATLNMTSGTEQAT